MTTVIPSIKVPHTSTILIDSIKMKLPFSFYCIATAPYPHPHSHKMARPLSRPTIEEVLKNMYLIRLEKYVICMFSSSTF